MNNSVQQAKQRFGIIGNHPQLNQAIGVAIQVALTDLSILITGQSGVGKEAMAKIIHQYSARKHNNYIAINCGAIPEGTIDSELFGHEKGAFTGAYEARKGYFEMADEGTIFLDEVAELPVTTQVRLLRVLETGEYIRVGASKAQKTNVRIVAATNIDIPQAIAKGKFREDLYYRLNTVPIYLPALVERKEDIYLLFRKFVSDFSDKYKVFKPQLDEKAVELIENYGWPGNIRQLKNVAEQITIIEQKENIDEKTLSRYLPNNKFNNLPVIYNQSEKISRDVLYKILFTLRKDVAELKKVVFSMLKKGDSNHSDLPLLLDYDKNTDLAEAALLDNFSNTNMSNISVMDSSLDLEEKKTMIKEEKKEESFLLADKEKELIIKALERFKGKRKRVAGELGISERTLYRKIKEYNLEEY